MELKFSKKARKVVASLLAVAILFGILPVSGLTSVSTSDEIDNSEDSAKTIYVKSDDYQPVLFDKDGKFKGIIPESDKENVYITKAVEGDNIALFDDKNISKDDSVVFYENTNDWSTPYAYLWQDDSSHNAKWHSEAMTKCSDDTNLYYYVYPSKSFSYVIFNDNGSEQTGDNNLNDWYVYSYSKNGENGKSVYDSLIHCEVGDANIYEQSESKLESKNISEPQGMGAIIKVADNEYTVCGVDAVDSIDCYEDDDIYGFTANAVDGYTAEATGEEDNNKIKYSVTYTNDTYGMQFFVENEVTFNKSPRLKVDGEFKVDFNGKSDYKNNDIIYNLTGEVKDLKASFEPSVYFEGETITEGYEVSITLNGKEFTSSCKSTDLTKGLNKGDNKGNKLVATVSYDNYSVKSEFSFDYVECDVTLSKLDYDNNVYIKNNDIYSNGTGNVELLLNTGSDDIDKNKLEFKLYKCDASPDSKEEIEDAIGFDKDNSIIKIYKQKLSEAKSANLEITSKDYNLSKTYTISYDTISKDNFKYSNTNENNERYYVNADTGVNVTFQLDGIDATLFNNESTKVECNDVNVKPEFDASNKVWKAKIKKSASYKFTFENNEFKQEVSLDATDLYLDDTAPEIKSFKFEDGSSAGNKLLSFLTFGIYHNEAINVTVTAEDPEVDGVSSGIDNWKEENHAEIQLYSTENQEKITAGDYNYSDKDGLSRTFTLACGEKESNQYMLTAKAWDNVHNGSVSYTFEKPEAAKYSSSDKLTAKLSDSADTDVVTNTIDPIVNSITSVAYGSDSVKHTDSKNKEWYSKNIEFSISVKDSNDDNYHTGIKEVTAEFNKNDVSDRLTGLPDDFTTKKVESVDNITFNTDGLALKKGENTVEVTVVNNSGMSSAKEYGVYVDDTAPKIKSFKFEDGSSAGNKLLSFLTFGIYHNEAINVTVTAEDPEVDGVSSGIDNWKEENHAEIQLYSTENQEKITAGDYNYSDKDGLSRTFTLACGEKESNQYMLTAKAWDNVHNGSVSYTFEKPEAAKYSSSDKLTAKLSDSADTDVVTNTIDPIVNSITSVAYGSDSVKHTDSKNKEWYSKNIEFSISVKDSNDDNYHTGIKEVTAEFNKNDVSDRLTGLPDDFTTKKVESVDNITFNTDGLALKKGENTVEVTVVNNSGMSSAKEYGVYVDDTAPKIKSFKFEPTKTNNSNEKPTENKNTYGYYVNSETTVTVTAEDELSGVKEIHYRAVDLNGNIKQNGSRAVDTNNSIWFTVEPDFKGYIYAYAVDNVYNGSEEYHPDGLVVESGEMHAESSGITATLPNSSYSADGNPLYSGDITIPVTVTDSYSGIKKIEYSVKSDYDTQNNHSQEIELDNSVDVSSVDNWSVDKTDNNLVTQMSRNITVSNNSNDIVLTVKLTDRAGNETEIEKKFSIDKTKPTIDVEYDNNEHTTYGENDYYKADRTATVTVTERNFDESLVEAAIMRDGGGYTTIGGWTHNNNSADPDKSTHVATIVYNTDGDFTFDIAVKDKAMNSADEFTQHKFTVDKTAPEIEVSFDNNSSKNGNYYKADRTATIKITEHNFNSGSQYVTIPVTADGATAPSVVGWSDSGDNHNATVSFNKDGKYSFTVDYTDLAGNKAVQKTVDSFYIDKTAPEVEITGVEDHQAYNGTVAPIVTYKDDNFTDDHDFQFTKIDINNRSTDTSMFEYDTDGNGVTEFIYKYRDFAETVENDGIYNFTVELSDKAGNSTSKSVTFSVNRFGSTFMAYDESMKKLFNNGYTNAEQDIVIEEINVSPLTKHSVTLAKSGGKSSELVENSDYKFTSSSSNTEWSKSIYTVNKQNFSDEAEYTVTIMSVDKAKNTNNNRMADSSLSTKEKSERECSITFVVDKTSPLVSITGIKDNERYKEASKTVKIVCEDDNLDKTKLVVTLDDKTLAEGEDYTIVEDSDNSLAGMLTAEIVLKAARGGVEENLNVAIDDLAGNTGEKSIGNFILSANIFQRFFANPVLVICTFAGLALVIAAVIFFIAKKRKKAE